MRHLLFALFLLSACGATSSSDTKPTPEPKPGTSLILKSFAATYCVPCIEELPELDSAISSLPEAVRSKLEVQVFVTDVTTEEAADKWLSKLSVKLKGYPDYRCKTEYKKFWSGCTIPATVLVRPDGTVVKNFGVGKPNMDSLLKVIEKEVK
jgi:hypothetical protein